MKPIVLKLIFVLPVIMAVFYLSSCKCSNKMKGETVKIEADTSCLRRCDLVPDPGMCKAYMPRYYYDKKEGKCKEFIWGGCNGVVPFMTLEACEKCDCEKK